MKTLLGRFDKRIAVILAMVLFVFASGYTCIFSLSKSITIELNERKSSYDKAEVNTIENANLNKTLGEILEENDLPTSDRYEYGYDLDTKVREIADTLTINKKIDGTLKTDDQLISFYSGAETVGDLLNEYDIRLSPSDIVEPSADTLITASNPNIVIYRQYQERESREEAIPYETINKNDPNLASGQVVVDIPGIEGKKYVTEDVKYRDGMAIDRTLIDETMLLEPIAQVQRVGTGTGSASSGSGSSSNRNNLQVSYGGYNGTTLSQEDFDLVCAIVEHEGGSSYDSALAVMSCVMNRVDAPGYGSDPVSVLTAPGQFASYLDGYYKQFLGRSSTVVREAVRDCLNGVRSHNYLNFRSYQTTGSVQIGGGNWYF